MYNTRDPGITSCLVPLMDGKQAAAPVCSSARYPKFSTEWNILIHQSHARGIDVVNIGQLVLMGSGLSLNQQPLALKMESSIIHPSIIRCRFHF